MRRREFIAGLGSIAARPLAARAQGSRQVRRVGVLMIPAENDPEGRRRVEAFQQGLEKLGWTVGRNLVIDYRWNISEIESARTAAAQLLRLAPDVLLANGSPALPVAEQVTSSVPIVFTGVNEPVAMGFIASLARPGGNVTGFTNFEPTFGAKWLQLLKEIAPGINRVGVIFNPATNPSAVLFARSAEAVAQKFAVEVAVAPVHEPAEIEANMKVIGREPGGGLLFPSVNFTALHRALILELAARHRLPAIYVRRFFVDEGGLIAYGIDIVDQFRQAATYVDRILRGEKPGDLPVQQPTKFDLAINLKTAKALGLTIPETLLATADEVIE